MGIGKDFFPLMSSLCYNFNDITLLQTALTHVSYSNEMKVKGFRTKHNETLEFLGDAVLELIISEELYHRYSELGEGALTKMRQSLVCEKTLAKIGAELRIGDYINIGNGEESLGIRGRDKVIADALEAIIAAIYLDDMSNGAENYKSIILSLFEKEIAFVLSNGSSDFKTRLQQFVEKNGDATLIYEYTEEGPEHDKVFFATAYINNNKVGSGKGTTKRRAEAEAARAALKLFGIE